MVTMIRCRRPLGATLAAAALLGLTACGGGGGGDGGGVQQAGELAISADNADNVARAAAMGTSMGPLAATLGQGMVSPGGFSQVVVQQARRARALLLRQAQTDRRAQAGGVVPCSVSGSLSVQVSDGNGSGALDAAGESISLTANSCDDGSGVMSGNFAVTLSSYASQQNFGFDFSFNGFSITDASGVAAIDGAMHVEVAAGTTLTLTASSLSARATVAGVPHSMGLSNFRVALQDQGDRAAEQISGTFVLGDYANQAVTLSTPTTIVQLYADDYPSSGVLQVNGAGGSVLRLQALNATQAQLSVDAQGDGSFETSRTVNWADLV